MGQRRSTREDKAADNHSTPSADQVSTGLLVEPEEDSPLNGVFYGLFRVLPAGGAAPVNRSNVYPASAPSVGRRRSG